MRIANAALSCLRLLDKLDGLYDPSNKLIFCVNDREMKQYHQGEFSTRKPDVVLVFDTDMKVDHTPEDDDDLYFQVAAQKPKQRFGWRNIRTAIEFKTGSIASPPTQYTKGKYIEPRSGRKYLSLRVSDDSELVMAPPAAESVSGK